MNIVYVSDFFLGDVNGGAEQNDAVLLSLLKNDERINGVEKIYSDKLTLDFLTENKESLYVISNFIKMPYSIKKELTDNHKYIIYEHDHKYLQTRDPSVYENYEAPEDEKANKSFYNAAQKVLCQSNFHAKIISLNLPRANVVSLNGNLWTHDTLDYIESICELEKTKNIAILDSPIAHKNTKGSRRYCEYKEEEYTLIGGMAHHDFLEELGKHEYFLFTPLTCETLSRILVEARMLNCKIVSSENVGAVHETWFQEKKGKELIEHVRNMHENILEKVIG